LETPHAARGDDRWPIGVFAQQCPGYWDTVVLLDSTPVECGRSVETAKRSHSRWSWGMRLHLLAAPDGTPRAAIQASADQKERDVALRLFPIGLHGGELVIFDKGYAGRPRTNLTTGSRSRGIRQRIESIFWTLKDRPGLERHRARSLHLGARIATKLPALAAGVRLNHYLNVNCGGVGQRRSTFREIASARLREISRNDPSGITTCNSTRALARDCT
jgi:hypothetical protein